MADGRLHMWPKYSTEQSGPLPANEPIWDGVAPGCSGDLHRERATHRNIPISHRYRDFPIVVLYRGITIGREGHMAKHTARLRAPGDFGLAVQQVRLARGLSQTELAAELGVPQSTISEIESGKATIYVRRLLSIARVTGLEFTASWEDDDAPRG